jgi:hypothetical protein
MTNRPPPAAAQIARDLLGVAEEAVSIFRGAFKPGQAAPEPPPTGTQPESSTLALLRRIDERTARMEDRLTSVERQIARLAADVAEMRLEQLDQRSRPRRD